MTEFNPSICNSWWGKYNFGFAVRNSEGRSGGLVCVWNKEVFQVSSKWEINGVVIVNVKWIKEDIGCCLINVYAPAGAGEKAILWDLIKTIVEQNEDRSVCVMGDFNAVQKREERAGNGDSFGAAEARNFDRFICDSGLSEIRSQGRKFTWYKPNGKCKKDWGPRPFRFLNVWMSHPEFEQKVKKVWTENRPTGWRCFVVSEKLKKLKTELKVWNNSIFGNIDERIKDLKAELLSLDQKDERNEMGESENIRRNEIQANLTLQLKDKQRVLHQKAKVRWLKNGDLNTGFFHRAIRGRRKMNEIAGLFFENQWVSNPSEVKTKVRDHFEGFFKRNERHLPNLPNDFLKKKLSDDERH
ncbi:uncharacterized protein LOC131025629 [Salvia miltiorrhiza]|uniref:uncharacterized protein LOC131025629 n=1 Tax=Salvia miltiorrhiza TaxID=226208 RepID=UPI0025AB7E7F|nr:uncharacterized protein LOC131025629 [Salvia miltiorrhiza]